MFYLYHLYASESIIKHNNIEMISTYLLYEGIYIYIYYILFTILLQYI